MSHRIASGVSAVVATAALVAVAWGAASAVTISTETPDEDLVVSVEDILIPAEPINVQDPEPVEIPAAPAAPVEAPPAELIIDPPIPNAEETIVSDPIQPDAPVETPVEQPVETVRSDEPVIELTPPAGEEVPPPVSLVEPPADQIMNPDGTPDSP